VADDVDRLILSRCEPPVLDLGSGPGRMVRALTESGRSALGVDISAQAVSASMRQGALALRARIEDPLPAEGRWGTVLLMDGNVGIGGNVADLLARCRQLVAPGGLIICEVDPVGSRHDREIVVLRSRSTASMPLVWSRIGAAALVEVAAGLDLWTAEEWSAGDRAFVALRRGL
jgi:SAM-dependent methyltransferase